MAAPNLKPCSHDFSEWPVECSCSCFPQQGHGQGLLSGGKVVGQKEWDRTLANG